MTEQTSQSSAEAHRRRPRHPQHHRRAARRLRRDPGADGPLRRQGAREDRRRQRQPVGRPRDGGRGSGVPHLGEAQADRRARPRRPAGPGPAVGTEPRPPGPGRRPRCRSPARTGRGRWSAGSPRRSATPRGSIWRRSAKRWPVSIGSRHAAPHVGRGRRRRSAGAASRSTVGAARARPRRSGRRPRPSGHRRPPRSWVNVLGDRCPRRQPHGVGERRRVVPAQREPDELPGVGPGEEHGHAVGVGRYGGADRHGGALPDPRAGRRVGPEHQALAARRTGPAGAARRSPRPRAAAAAWLPSSANSEGTGCGGGR